MKKLLLIVPMVLVALLVSNCSKDEGGTDKLAVGTVAESNASLVVKFSGSKCPPCGSWGWSMMSDLIAGVNPEDGVMTVYGDNFVADLFIVPEATELQNAWGASGYPHFGANGSVTSVSRSGGVNTAAEKAEIFERVNNHKDATVVANTGLKYEIVDGMINMKYKTKAFSELSGDNYLAIYVVENKVVGAQSGHPDGANTQHKHILRNEVTGNGYGVSIGSLTANQEVSGETSFAMGADWNADNIEIITAIYTKNGTKYEFVNSSRGELVVE